MFIMTLNTHTHTHIAAQNKSLPLNITRWQCRSKRKKAIAVNEKDKPDG